MLFYTDFLFQTLKKGIDPLQSLENAQNNPYLFKRINNNYQVKEEIRNFYSLQSVFLRNFKNSQGKFLDKNDLKRLVSKPAMVQVYVGLILEKERKTLRKISFSKSDGTAKSALQMMQNEKIANKIDTFRIVFESIHKIRLKVEELRASKGPDKVTRSDILDFGGEFTTNSLKAIDALSSLFGGSSIITKTKEVISVSELTLQIVKNIDEKRLSLALINAMTLFRSIGVNPDSELFQVLQKYGPFIVNLAEAESEEAVKNALEAVALTPLLPKFRFTGSSKIWMGIKGSEYWIS